MPLDAASLRWLKRLTRDGRPLYLAIAEALEAAVREGELQPGDQLPPQRAVAEALGIDFTTVTRAYGAARARGLLEGAVGRGTFVRGRAAEDEAGLVDLSMNLPPPPDGISLGAQLRAGVDAILARTDAATLMAYHPGAGTLGQKAAGAAWLAPVLGDVPPERLMVAPGAQTALAAALQALARPGDALIVEPLTYPGLIAIAGRYGLRMIPCPVDDEGFQPEALARLCADERATAIYLVPTTQNPTCATMGLARRREIAAIAEAAGAWLFEDDPYSRLFDAPAPALAGLAPTRGVYIATLSKCLTPGLRIAYLMAPAGEASERCAESLRALGLMAPPLMAALATAWIREGTAEAILAGVRREARARRAIARETLPRARGADEALHVWLDLPAGTDSGQLRLMAQQRGLALVTAEAFSAGPGHPNGVRVSLGGPAKRAVLAQSLQTLAGLVGRGPAARPMVV
ncbi:aminotransferase-like domain-containing protein [Phenylobacterium montanum]|uniref:PLP-dependent aminotransferase family protein n=1 Tax=Phenylobacterium montanum TaxID=2823693 RepID=A0A975G4N0_9CAUL|nr:PLP-dependent aminotransferase family protein [Caulobacter sp. S6]QUD90502.1 PLP-dependent aminotransferase family protein [Caulobacter sp. S6]